jgi:hypothetical protein
MRARFERDIERRSTSAFAGLSQGHHFSMWPTRRRGPTFTNDRAIALQHSTNGRVRRRATERASGQCQRPLHPGNVDR